MCASFSGITRQYVEDNNPIIKMKTWKLKFIQAKKIPFMLVSTLQAVYCDNVLLQMLVGGQMGVWDAEY